MRTDAQLVVARQFGFSSWPKLRAHLELVARYARFPHHQPIGRPLTDDQAVIDEFLLLACLNYGDDDPDRFRRAAGLLDQNEWLARASIYTIAATGDVDAAAELLGRDASQASRLRVAGSQFSISPTRGCRSDPVAQGWGSRGCCWRMGRIRTPAICGRG